jgi:arylsulfatase A-like enzyme
MLNRHGTSPGSFWMRLNRATPSAAVVTAVTLALLAGVGVGWTSPPPSVLLVTVDTLRADRLTGYGYQRPTSPEIDDLMDRGARFSRAWTVEPLTNPALSSMITGLLPHEHGASRNGLRLQEDLPSLPKKLAAEGWATAAVVSNWTLKKHISGLDEHFQTYLGVFTRRRWFGILNAEATGEDVTDTAAEWIAEHTKHRPEQPFLLWVHYVEPHAPYRFQKRYAHRLGIGGGNPSRSDRYDTEIAEVDAQVGRLLESARAEIDDDRLLIFFAADHGESLGEHDFWGHGRFLYEPSLRIPMAFVWQGVIEQQTVDAQATIVDLGPTVLELLDFPVPEEFRGTSWADVLRGRTEAVEEERCYQAHRGAVHGAPESERARSKGLLSVGRIDGHHKEIIVLKGHRRQLFDLVEDPGELRSLVDPSSAPTDELVQCLGEISESLGSLDRLKVEKMDDETVEQLRALGYIE